MAIVTTVVRAEQPAHACDTDYSEADCVYFNTDSGDNIATVQDACLVYKYSNFCIRCMDGSFLTPTLTGQFCSYLVDSDGVWVG